MARRRRRLASRVRGYVRGFLAFLFSNVGVVVLVIAYTIAGAFMFQAIEGASEMERVSNMTRERDNTARYLWQNVTLTLNLFNETALKERISIELLHYQRKIVVAVRRGWDGGISSRQWSFSSAFLYSMTVITTIDIVLNVNYFVGAVSNIGRTHVWINIWLDFFLFTNIVIGYGHLSPRTSWGKIVTIFYALLGMPLFLLYLSNVGDLLANWFKCIYALICMCRGCPGFTRRRVVHFRSQLELSDIESIERPVGWRPEYSESEITPEPVPYGHREPRPDPRRDYFRSISLPQPSRYPRPDQIRGWSEPLPRPGSVSSDFTYVTFDVQTITVPISACVTFMVGYLIFGSMLFGMWEKWDKLDGAYFCFISLSSIGFGDFVPGERVYTPRIETSFIVCSLYLMLGMALVAMCFNLMQEQVLHYYACLKRVMKRICRCKR